MRRLGALFLLLSCFAWAGDQKPSLYKRLGERKGISKVCSLFVDTVTSDPRLLANPKIAPLVKNTPKMKIKTRLTDRMCQFTGGPCQLKGEVIENLPKGTKLGPLEWFYVMQDLNTTLEKCQVPKAEQKEILGLLLKKR